MGSNSVDSNPVEDIKKFSGADETIAEIKSKNH